MKMDKMKLRISMLNPVILIHVRHRVYLRSQKKIAAVANKTLNISAKKNSDAKKRLKRRSTVECRNCTRRNWLLGSWLSSRELVIKICKGRYQF